MPKWAMVLQNRAPYLRWTLREHWACNLWRRGTSSLLTFKLCTFLCVHLKIQLYFMKDISKIRSLNRLGVWLFLFFILLQLVKSSTIFPKRNVSDRVTHLSKMSISFMSIAEADSFLWLKEWSFGYGRKGINMYDIWCDFSIDILVSRIIFWLNSRQASSSVKK